MTTDKNLEAIMRELCHGGLTDDFSPNTVPNRAVRLIAAARQERANAESMADSWHDKYKAACVERDGLREGYLEMHTDCSRLTSERDRLQAEIDRMCAGTDIESDGLTTTNKQLLGALERISQLEEENRCVAANCQWQQARAQTAEAELANADRTHATHDRFKQKIRALEAELATTRAAQKSAK